MVRMSSVTLQLQCTRVLGEIEEGENRERALEYVLGSLITAIENKGMARSSDLGEALRRASSIYRDGRWPDDQPEDS